MRPKHLLIGALLVVLTLILVACSTAQPETAVETTPCPSVECPECPEAEPCPECPTCPEPVVDEIPFEEAWANSPHNAAEDEAFVHWDEEGEIPQSCAKCHSTPGYVDWMGADGSEFRVVDAAAEIGTTITCVACHNAATAANDSVLFPSGVEIEVADASSRCARCHQGRASTVDVMTAIQEAGLEDDPDAVSEELTFINIHYYAAAATLYGSQVHGGFEYEGQTYEDKFDHVAGYDTCIGCHSPHTLELKVEECAACHEGVASVDDIRNIRMVGSLMDYDGDGDNEEPIRAELEGLMELLYGAIQSYATEVAGTPIVYEVTTHPYWFQDSDGDGQVTEGEAVRDNAYATWTPRLLKAAYNYQVALKDPGAYAHNGKYIIELLHDSIADLNESLPTPVDLEAAARIDAGHFASNQEAFRHWDEDEPPLVPADCSRCHTSEGLPYLLTTGDTRTFPPSSGLNCATCHDDLTTFTRFVVEEVTMPSGKTVAFGEADPNLCLMCHQGRESTASVNAAIERAGVGDDTVSEALSFRNPHYFAAGATLWGSQASGAYEFDGQAYNGRFLHVENFDTCEECHNAHSLEIQTQACTACHGSEDPETYRISQGDPIDYDGDGDTAEGIAGEVETMGEALYAALQQYAINNPDAPAIAFNAASYPYWFIDTNENGEADPDEANFGNRFVTWTPDLLRAAYNYTWALKDPGSFAHNGDYIMQVLYDSINAVGGSTQGMTRPEVQAPPAEEGG